MTKRDEIADLRQELKDLEAVTARQDTPLSPYMMGIAQAKIATLQRQIKELEQARATLTSLPTSGDLV